MKKILLLALIITVSSMSYRSLKKEQCSVARKFEIENKGQLEYHFLVKFADGTIQDEVVSDSVYKDIKELDFYYAIKN